MDDKKGEKKESGLTVEGEEGERGWQHSESSSVNVC